MAFDRGIIRSRIEKILSNMELLDGQGPLDEDAGLLGRGIGLDSVEIIQLVTALEEEFDLTIDDDDLVPDHFFTLGDLVSFLAENYLK